MILPSLCAGVAQLVEHFLAKEDVASSSLVTRSTRKSLQISKLQLAIVRLRGQIIATLPAENGRFSLGRLQNGRAKSVDRLRFRKKNGKFCQVWASIASKRALHVIRKVPVRDSPPRNGFPPFSGLGQTRF